MQGHINMTRFSHRLLTAATLTTLLYTSLSPLPVSAQSRDSVLQRLENLERQLSTMNYNSGGRAVPPGNNVGSAQQGVQLTAFEEEIRRLSGRLEELEHQQRRVSEQFEMLQKDNEARFQALEARIPAAPPPVIGGSAEPAPSAPVINGEPAPAVTPVEQPQAAGPASPAPAGDSQYTNAREHYDAAFKALNQSNYPAASQLFTSFTQQYPKDVLIGNAYYWLGETYYVQRQYGQSAEQFRQGFESMPEGPKAPDNLLKLGMSLSALNRKDEACVVLNQLLKKYGGQSQVIERKATMEKARLQCGN